jgi:hypothetical protein
VVMGFRVRGHDNQQRPGFPGRFVSANICRK